MVHLLLSFRPDLSIRDVFGLRAIHYCAFDNLKESFAALAAAENVTDTLELEAYRQRLVREVCSLVPRYDEMRNVYSTEEGAEFVSIAAFYSQRGPVGEASGGVVATNETGEVVAGGDGAAGQSATAGAGQSANAGAGQSANAGAGQSANAGAGQSATAGAGQSTTAGAGQSATAGAGQSATAGAGQSTTATAESSAATESTATATTESAATATTESTATATEPTATTQSATTATPASHPTNYLCRHNGHLCPVRRCTFCHIYTPPRAFHCRLCDT